MAGRLYGRAGTIRSPWPSSGRCAGAPAKRRLSGDGPLYRPLAARASISASCTLRSRSLADLRRDCPAPANAGDVAGNRAFVETGEVGLSAKAGQRILNLPRLPVPPSE